MKKGKVNANIAKSFVKMGTLADVGCSWTHVEDLGTTIDVSRSYFNFQSFTEFLYS